MIKNIHIGTINKIASGLIRKANANEAEQGSKNLF